LQLSELHRTKEPTISFELFPPKTPEAQVQLFDQTIPELLQLSPAFVTCTYGAGGSTRDQTLEVVSRIKNQFGTEAASHLTCVGASREEIAAYLEQARHEGITNLIALRGDPPQGDTVFKPHPDGFQHANELVAFIRSLGGFSVAVAGYPEGHPECPDKYLDWQRCRDKVEAGADVVITQLFYDNNDFFAFDDYLRNKLGVTVPIVPGVFPILSAKQIRHFCSLCGARLPDRVQARLEQYADDSVACRQYGVELATEMCDALLRCGVPGLHFYTLNRARATAEVMTNLGLARGSG